MTRHKLILLCRGWSILWAVGAVAGGLYGWLWREDDDQ